VRPRRGRDLLGRCPTFAEREEIAIARARGQGVRQIAYSLGRSPSTISRELQRNVEGTKSYRATTAHVLAYEPGEPTQGGEAGNELGVAGQGREGSGEEVLLNTSHLVGVAITARTQGTVNGARRSPSSTPELVPQPDRLEGAARDPRFRGPSLSYIGAAGAPVCYR
jgi:Helix-turn-helix domain